MTDFKQNNRHNLNPETLRDLQASLYDWQNYNFGASQDNELVLLGICEEAGELCHAHLKMEQGIRGGAADHEAAMRDAVGDICIYLLNYLSGQDQYLPQFVPTAEVQPTQDFSLIRKATLSVFRLVGRMVEEPHSMQRVKHLLNALLYLCALKDWDLESIIRETWLSVGQRDWKKYPKTGHPPHPEPS